MSSNRQGTVVYTKADSAPRILFAGTKIVQAAVPEGTRVLYPNPPISPLSDLNGAIQYALNHPYDSPPLHALLRPGMKVVIAVDDISLPLPPMRPPDIRQLILTQVIELLDNHGVTDIEIIIAIAYHRKMTSGEIKKMVGKEIYNRFSPNRLYNFDAEDKDNLVVIGKTDRGVEVDFSKPAAESDLIIYVNINFSPLNGGYKSLGVGLCGGKALNSHHDVRTMLATDCFMDPKHSALHTGIEDIGKVINSKNNVFHIETTLNNKMMDDAFAFLTRDPDTFSRSEKLLLNTVISTLNTLPEPSRDYIFENYRAPYGVTGVFAGATEATHQRTMEYCYKQYLVPVKGQADIQITGIPFISPYNVHSFLNPLLVQVLAQGYFFNLHHGMPLLKKGGTLIITHPLSDRFDSVQHTPYVEFVHSILATTRNGIEIHKRFEAEFSARRDYIEDYQNGNAFHPNHAFYMWYWGEKGRQYQGRCIVVGADNDHMPKILGYESARSMSEAIKMALETAPPNPSITCANYAPVLIPHVT